MGKEYATLVLPGMPSLDIVRTDATAGHSSAFQFPLIKATTGDKLIDGLQR
jgi:hypothetical protein